MGFGRREEGRKRGIRSGVKKGGRELEMECIIEIAHHKSTMIIKTLFSPTDTVISRSSEDL